MKQAIEPPDYDEGELMTQLSDRNKAMTIRNAEAFNARDREAFDSFFANPFIVHSRDGEHEIDHDTHWEAVTHVFEAFPDIRATIENMIAEHDQIFIRCTYAGTQQGAYRGIEPTGRWVEWTLLQHFRIQEDLIVEASPLADELHLYAQLGAIDPPAEVYRTQR